ncbi:MAG: sugar transferase [Chitinophagaceae bacterium]|nr:sugar transferase [Chitinophagaceae bacterium]
MSRVLQNEPTPSKTYRHYSLPPAELSASSIQKKLNFFYIGKKTGVIDSLIRSFANGYAAETPDQARPMLKKMILNTGSAPDVIIAESGIGQISLLLFSQFLNTHRQLKAVPFIIEGSSMNESEAHAFRTDRFIDDIVSLNEIEAERLVQKVRFWKKVKQRINSAQKHVNEELPSVQNSASEFSKRIFDIIVSALLMVILSPIFLLVMLAVKIESKGPIFYISKRAGRGYKIFNFYKFRTMVVEANDKIADFSHLNMYNPLKENGPVFIKIDNDPRITRIGAFLRKCSLDELPQLWNVFLGDMSLVGNRPLPLYEAATLTTDEWAKRFMAPAGMTGLWQIKKKNKYQMSAEERISLDINYADNSSFFFDLWIMANTPSAVIQRTNA